MLVEEFAYKGYYRAEEEGHEYHANVGNSTKDYSDYDRSKIKGNPYNCKGNLL